MRDILLLSKDNKSYHQLEQLAKDKGFRVKATTEESAARELLKARAYDLALVDADVAIEDQQELAKLLWHANPVAVFVLFDLEGESTVRRTDARLYGAEVVRGKDALAQIETYLNSLTPRSDIKKEDLKILVVEDLDSPRDIICAFIEGIGYPVVRGVRSVKEALKELESNPQQVSCIVTDVRMPGLTGQDLITAVRASERFRTLPIIVLTAYGTVDCLIDCLKAGASGFLVKPPKKEDLLRELGRALRISKQRLNPRLATPDEAEGLREQLMNMGL